MKPHHQVLFQVLCFAEIYICNNYDIYFFFFFLFTASNEA